MALRLDPARAIVQSLQDLCVQLGNERPVFVDLLSGPVRRRLPIREGARRFFVILAYIAKDTVPA